MLVKLKFDVFTFFRWKSWLSADNLPLRIVGGLAGQLLPCPSSQFPVGSENRLRPRRQQRRKRGWTYQFSLKATYFWCQFHQQFMSVFVPISLCQKSSNLKCKHKKVLRKTFVWKSRTWNVGEIDAWFAQSEFQMRLFLSHFLPLLKKVQS